MKSLTKSKNMKISIIVCAYNGEKEILICLKALLNQSNVRQNEYEIFVIDDGSTDFTGKVVKEFISKQKTSKEVPPIQYIKIEHKGLSVGRNTGLFLAKAPLVAYIDQDATPDKNWIHELLNAWEAHPNADAIGGKIFPRNTHSKVAVFLHDVLYGPMTENNIIGTNMSYTKDRLLQVNGFGDPFVSRGDETFVFSKMGDSFNPIIWSKAIVHHDWPTSFKKWIRERQANGRLARLTNRLYGRDPFCYSYFLISRSLLYLIGISMLCLFPHKAGWIFLSFLLLFIVQVLRKPTNALLKKKYSSLKSFFMASKWLFLSELGIWNAFWGWFCARNSTLDRESAMKGTISEQYIIERFNNIKGDEDE